MTTLLLCIALLLLDASFVSARPKFVDDYLSGRNVLKSTPLDRFDPKSGYYLLDERHDGGGRLVLVKDPELAGYESDRPGEMKDFEESFPHGHLRLSTGKGVRIGDTASQVRRRLGPPTSAGKLEGNHHGLELDYNYNYSVRKRPQFYSAEYKFQDGKLWSIEIDDEPPVW